jgi:hypothetical protein
MTNQEVNQVYWELPEHFRAALDLMLTARDVPYDKVVYASALMVSLSSLLDVPEVASEEALAWTEWRIWLDTGKDD